MHKLRVRLRPRLTSNLGKFPDDSVKGRHDNSSGSEAERESTSNSRFEGADHDRARGNVECGPAMSRNVGLHVRFRGLRDASEIKKSRLQGPDELEAKWSRISDAGTRILCSLLCSRIAARQEPTSAVNPLPTYTLCCQHRYYVPPDAPASSQWTEVREVSSVTSADHDSLCRDP